MERLSVPAWYSATSSSSTSAAPSLLPRRCQSSGWRRHTSTSSLARSPPSEQVLLQPSPPPRPAPAPAPAAPRYLGWRSLAALAPPALPTGPAERLARSALAPPHRALVSMAPS